MATFVQRVTATEACFLPDVLSAAKKIRVKPGAVHCRAKSKGKRRILRRGRHASGTPRFSAESPLQCGASWPINSPRQRFEAYLLRALGSNYLAVGE
jgi:hypothetical protein